jgi:hypothetical protein
MLTESVPDVVSEIFRDANGVSRPPRDFGAGVGRGDIEAVVKAGGIGSRLS